MKIVALILWEKLSAIGDTLDEDQLKLWLVSMVSLDLGTHSYILCARKGSMKFDIVWEYCIQEEARVANREALLREDDQALAIHTKGRKKSNFKKGSHKPSKKKFQKKRGN